jgi:hypothetical protein
MKNETIVGTIVVGKDTPNAKGIYNRSGPAPAVIANNDERQTEVSEM